MYIVNYLSQLPEPQRPSVHPRLPALTYWPSTPPLRSRLRPSLPHFAPHVAWRLRARFLRCLWCVGLWVGTRRPRRRDFRGRGSCLRGWAESLLGGLGGSFRWLGWGGAGGGVGFVGGFGTCWLSVPAGFLSSTSSLQGILTSYFDQCNGSNSTLLPQFFAKPHSDY